MEDNERALVKRVIDAGIAGLVSGISEQFLTPEQRHDRLDYQHRALELAYKTRREMHSAALEHERQIAVIQAQERAAHQATKIAEQEQSQRGQDRSEIHRNGATVRDNIRVLRTLLETAQNAEERTSIARAIAESERRLSESENRLVELARAAMVRDALLDRTMLITRVPDE